MVPNNKKENKIMKKILALVLAMMMLTLSACAVAEEAAVMTHEEYAAAELYSEVTLSLIHI